MLGDQPLARLLALGVVHHHDVMPGDVRHDGIFVIGALELRQEILGHPLQFGLRELYGLLRLRDVGLVIGRQPRQLLAHPLHLVPLRLGQVQARPPVITHRLGQQLGVLAFEPRLLVRVGFDGLVNILAVVNADRPLLQLLQGLGGRVTHRGAGAGLLDQPEAVIRKADLIANVVQGADGVLERDLPRLEGSEAVQGGVPDRDGLPQVEHEQVGRRLEVRQGNDGVELARAMPELSQGIGLISRLGQTTGSGDQQGQQKQPHAIPIHRALKLQAGRSQSSSLLPGG